MVETFPYNISEAAGGDAWESQTKVLTLTEEEFNEYKTGGYFRGIKYRWTSQGGTYTVYISKSSYDRLRQNMESGPAGKDEKFKSNINRKWAFKSMAK